jgi:hypothetical protein
MSYNYKVGDKVIITKNKSGHAFQIGERVTLATANNEENNGRGSYSAYGLAGLAWWFNGTECMPVIIESNQEAKNLLDKKY